MSSEDNYTLELDRCIEQLYQCKPLTEQEVKGLCKKAMEVLEKESQITSNGMW